MIVSLKEGSCQIYASRKTIPAMDKQLDNFPFELDPVIEAYKKDVDLTLLRENLKLTVEERFLKLMKLQEFAEELRKAGRELRARR